MRRATLHFTKTILTIVLICALNNVESQIFTNPIGSLADPFITYIDGYYYYTGTTGGDVSLKRAKTLEGLKQTNLQKIFGPGRPGAQQGNYWAPELFRLNGIWYIYYSASQQGDDIKTMRTYVLENTTNDPMNPSNWNFKSKIYSSGVDYWAIDGTVLEVRGELYFLWSGVDSFSNFINVDKPQRNYISKMKNPWTLTGARILLTSPPGVFTGNNVNEAPEILHKNGKIYMVYSSDFCGSPNYHLEMISIDDTKNPLTASNWKSHGTVFSSNINNNSYGTGHHSFFKSPDGTEDWIAYHATPKSTGDCSNTRTSRAKKISFNNEGVPQFGRPTAVGQPLKAPSGEPVLATGNITNGLYKINQINTSKIVEVKDALYINPANIIQGTDANKQHQQWWIQSTADGYYTIVSALSGLSMGVGSCKKTTFASVNLRKPSGSNCQQWKIEDLGSGHYKFTNKNSGLVMEVPSSGIDRDGYNILQNSWSNSSSQKFNLQLIQKTLEIVNLKIKKNILYPNPVKDKIYFSSTINLIGKHYRICNNLGQFVSEGIIRDNYILTKKLNKGVYYILIDNVSYKLIKS